MDRTGKALVDRTLLNPGPVSLEQIVKLFEHLSGRKVTAEERAKAAQVLASRPSSNPPQA